MTISELLTQDNDWRISDKQRSMISDKIVNMSKKEASLLIKIIEAMYNDRPNSEKGKIT